MPSYESGTCLPRLIATTSGTTSHTKTAADAKYSERETRLAKVFMLFATVCRKFLRTFWVQTQWVFLLAWMTGESKHLQSINLPAALAAKNRVQNRFPPRLAPRKYQILVGDVHGFGSCAFAASPICSIASLKPAAIISALAFAGSGKGGNESMNFL